MNSNFTKGFNKPAIFTAQTYGTKTTVEIDHSDLDLDEVMDAFQTLIIGMGYHKNSFKNWVIERADEYRETDAEELKEKLSEWRNEDVEDAVFHSKVKQSVKDAIARYNKDSEGYEDQEKLEDEFFGKYDYEAEKRMDIIGQNGNDGLHYGIDDEDEFDDYGERIPPNKVLIDAKKQYDEQLKMDAKKKTKK